MPQANAQQNANEMNASFTSTPAPSKHLFLESNLKDSKQTRVLRLSKSAGNLREEEENYKRGLESKYLTCTFVPKSFKRNLPLTAEVVLDAPNVIDDFCNLVILLKVITLNNK